MKSVLFILTFFILTTAQAGETIGFDRGNGGDAVICQNTAGETKVSLLDWFELTPQQTVSSVFLKSSSTVQLVNLMLDRVAQRYPIYGLYMRSRATDLLYILRFVNMNLKDVNDEGHVDLPANCTLHQLALNARHVDSLANRGIDYYINISLYEQLPPLQQAMLMMHELVYRLLLDFNPETNTSEEARALVRMIITSDFDKPELRPYFDLKFGFTKAAANGKK